MSKELFTQKLKEKISKNTKIVVIADKDGVLSRSHSKIEPIYEIFRIKKDAIFVAISGSNIDRAQGEIVDPLLKYADENRLTLDNIYLILNNGSSIYEFKDDEVKCIYRNDLSDEIGITKKKKALLILKETREKFSEIKELKEKYPKIRQINDEEVQIVLRILGKMKNDNLRYSFDPRGEKRNVWAKYIRKRFDEEGIKLDVSVDGTSSINILAPGINKGTGIDILSDKLGVTNSALLYLGDNFREKRNDRIAVENRIDLAVNLGDDLKEEIDGVTLIDSDLKNIDGARDYLRLIADEILKH